MLLIAIGSKMGVCDIHTLLLILRLEKEQTQKYHN